MVKKFFSAVMGANGAVGGVALLTLSAAVVKYSDGSLHSADILLGITLFLTAILLVVNSKLSAS